MPNQNGATEGFRYAPLDHNTHQFRLLRLLPSSAFNSDIRCEMFPSTMDECPPYEALSYVWGDPDITVPIQLHGSGHKVTRNLELALRYIRLGDRERVIQMRSIYLGARQVVVWLGEEDDAKIALDYFQTPYNKRNEALSRTVFNACQALFLQRPWWSRTWILQEVLHHNPVLVHLGNIILSLDGICDHGSLWDLERWACEMRYPEWVERKDNELQVFETVDVGIAEFDPVMTIGEQRKLLKENPDKLTGRPEQAPTLSLIKALQSYRSHQCGRQVDKVFALIGMADLGLYEPLIDYNMSKRATYTATMQSIFERDALLLVESPQRPISSMELPSWVPDWTTQQTLLAMHLAADLKKFNTVPVSDEFPLGSLRKQEEPYSFRGDTLVLQAIHVGTIISACFTMVRFGERGPPQTVKLFKYTESPSFEQEGVNHSANVAGDYFGSILG
ncbi:hypothetical protein BKA61DRAFT_727461 [Leptodontidium sp. MPI-SDFR-AT-0119]|nr:hypothetical protein BKA61DRAFT_727461 [Leptodontidium sp. MPI-SDFR-AT-0119]